MPVRLPKQYNLRLRPETILSNLLPRRASTMHFGRKIYSGCKPTKHSGCELKMRRAELSKPNSGILKRQCGTAVSRCVCYSRKTARCRRTGILSFSCRTGDYRCSRQIHSVYNKTGRKDITCRFVFRFLQAGLKRFPAAKTSNLSDGIFTKAAASDTVIFCLANDSSLQVLQQLYKAYPNKRYIIFSCLSPVFLSGIPEIPTAIALYSYAPVSFTAGFGALLGDF